MINDVRLSRADPRLQIDAQKVCFQNLSQYCFRLVFSACHDSKFLLELIVIMLHCVTSDVGYHLAASIDDGDC